MKEELYDDLLEEKDNQNNFKELFFKYIIQWPYILISTIICLMLAFVYLRFQPPVYEVTSSVLIKEDEKKSNANSAINAIQDLGMFSMTSNFDNEVEILHSRTLVKKVVTNLRLYTSISEKRFFGYSLPLYDESPLSVFMTAEEADKLFGSIKMDLEYTTKGELKVDARYIVNIDGDEEEVEKTFNSFPVILPTPVGVITIARNDTLPVEETRYLKAVISSPTKVAKAYYTQLTVEPTSKTSTIAAITLNDTHRKRGIDFIYALVELYNQDTNNEKNEVAQKSAEFIEERIGIINGELGVTENELADFKQRSGLTDLSSDAQLALEESSKYELRLTENATQISLVSDLRNYVDNPANIDEVIPANIGIQDVSLNTIIRQYNDLLIERKRLLRTSSENNPAVINLNTGIEATRHNVESTINSALRGLQIQRTDLERQIRKYGGRISDAPTQEKEFMTISRQQEIKATLYTMLLQKREENAITLAATANNGRIIENPACSEFPVAPKKKIIMLVALIIGMGIPMGVIYIIDLLSFRIEGRSDVEKLTSLPIIGDMPVSEHKNDEERPIVVRSDDNDIMTETFRSLRTSLLFMMGDSGKKTILVTSTTSGEGKTFISTNLATSLSLLGKKVIILGLDIRKPGLNKVFKLSTKDKGITQYLSAPHTTDIHTLIQPSNVTPNLYVLPGGAIPPNPTELVARQALVDVINILREEYDYIVMDTAPIGMVTDTQLIARVADASVYVCRADYTNKSAFNFINELRDNKRLPNLSLVINGLDMKKKKYGYYYGYGKYGKYYGYGKKYGYGGGYNYGVEPGNTKK